MATGSQLLLDKMELTECGRKKKDKKMRTEEENNQKLMNLDKDGSFSSRISASGNRNNS